MPYIASLSHMYMREGYNERDAQVGVTDGIRLDGRLYIGYIGSDRTCQYASSMRH